MELDNLIFDRTQADVDRVKELTQKLINGTATDAEKTEWFGEMKGAYNASDLNRVCAAVEYLTDLMGGLGYNIPTVLPAKKQRYVANNQMYVAKQIEYIESTGTQWIDTGFKHNQDTRVIMDVQPTKTPGANAWAFEGRNSNSVARHGVFFYQTTGAQWNGDYAAQRKVLSGIGATDRMTIDFNKNVLSINSVSVAFTASTFQSGNNLTLLAANTGGKIAGQLSARLYSCKIYDNGTLIRDFKPYYDSNGVACLYDAVSKTCYYNAGTGSFGASEAPTIKGYVAKQIEYIESTGTQYIDTDLQLPSGFRTVIDFMFTQQKTVIQCLLGSHEPNPPYYRNYFAVNPNFESWNLGCYDSAVFGAVSINTRYTVDVCNVYQQLSCVVNGVDQQLSQSLSTNSERSPRSIYLMAMNYPTELLQASIRLYSCKIYDPAGNLVRDYKPYYDSGGTACLYDAVSGLYFYNIGTGSFAASEEPTPEAIYWEETDIPTQSQMDIYINNIQLLRDRLPYVAPDAPDSPTFLTYEQANNTEEILYNLERVLIAMQEAFLLRQANTLFMIAGGVFNNA